MDSFIEEDSIEHIEDVSVGGSCADDEDVGRWCCVRKVSSSCHSVDNSVSNISAVDERAGWEDR